jgi:predicted amidohydrolase
LRDDVKRAWDAGVVMDIGRGAGSLSFETAEAVLAEGRASTTISTDLHQMSVHSPAVVSSDVDASPVIRVAGDGRPQFDLPTCMSKFLALGMPLDEVIAAATVRPAEVVGLAASVGSLRVGAAADVGLFELEQARTPSPTSTARPPRTGDASQPADASGRSRPRAGCAPAGSAVGGRLRAWSGRGP